jgi:heptosyltransferase II
VKPHGAEILYRNLDIDEIIIYNPNNQHKGLIDKINFLKKIHSGGYDAAVVLNNSSMSNFMAYVSGARIRAGRKSEPKRFSHTLTHWVSNKDPKGTKHEVDRNLDIVGLLDIDNEASDLVLNLSEEEKAYADDFLRPNNNDGSCLMGIHPGGSSFDKLWSPENFAEIADRLIDEFNAKVILFTGPGEDNLARSILAKARNPLIFASGIKLRQFSALVERCSLFVCNDSGPMHIASALKVPTVAIFGPTDYVRWRPHNENSVVVRKDMDCWPCSAHRCKRNYECTKDLPVSQVWKAIVELTSKVIMC